MQSDKIFLEKLLIMISNYLCEKYSKNETSDVIASHLKFQSQYREAVEEKNTKTEKSTYIPQGKAEIEFYKKLTNQLAKKH